MRSTGWFFFFSSLNGTSILELCKERSQGLPWSEALLWYTQLYAVLGAKLSPSWSYGKNFSEWASPRLDRHTAFVIISHHNSHCLCCSVWSNLSPFVSSPRPLCWFDDMLFQGRFFSFSLFLVCFFLILSMEGNSPASLFWGSHLDLHRKKMPQRLFLGYWLQNKWAFW